MLRNGQLNAMILFGESVQDREPAGPRIEDLLPPSPKLWRELMQMTVELQTILRIWPEIERSDDGFPIGHQANLVRTVLLDPEIRGIDRLVLRREHLPVTRAEAQMMLRALKRTVPPLSPSEGN